MRPVKSRISGRAPHGARGLKPIRQFATTAKTESRPTRGAWIETSIRGDGRSSLACRAPHGARGLKHDVGDVSVLVAGRAPHGARGLKQLDPDGAPPHLGRAPHGARGLKQLYSYIELYIGGRAPHGARGLKHLAKNERRQQWGSRPARGAWIETKQESKKAYILEVAPRMGRVD